MALFVKGQSGNPSGRPTAHSLAKIRDIARKRAPEMVEVLVKIALDEEAPHAARATCASAVLDRGYGKPAITVGDEEGNAQSWFELLANAQRRANFIEAPAIRLEHDVN